MKKEKTIGWAIAMKGATKPGIVGGEERNVYHIKKQVKVPYATLYWFSCNWEPVK